jgi:transposase-like protein
MREYPMTLEEFEKEFNTEEACRDYIFNIRWPNGFQCPRCGNSKAWPIGKVLFQCTSCHYRTSVIAGTIFQDTHKSLTMWFRAMWWVTSQKNGASALGLQKVLGLGSYETAWSWLHKLRHAMVRPGRDKLSGFVEVDDTYLGGEHEGKRGRGSENKVLVVIAVEVKDGKIGRIRISRIANASEECLLRFVQESVEKGSTVNTDGWQGYNGLTEKGYIHEVTVAKHSKKSELLPHVHLIISLLKRWLMGTHQGAVSNKHLDYYLDEYTFRFNRRASHYRGKLFYRLIQNAVVVEPVTYNSIVNPENNKEV